MTAVPTCSNGAREYKLIAVDEVRPTGFPDPRPTFLQDLRQGDYPTPVISAQSTAC
jgi:hypothetical protein